MLISERFRQVIARKNAGGATLWTPANMTTFAWYDPSDTGSITESAGSVSQIDDKSGNNRHAVQGNASRQPVTGIRTIGGLNVLEFDGANRELEYGTAVDLSSGLSMAAIFNQDTTASNDRAFGARSTSSSAKKTFAFCSDNSLRYDGANSSPSVSPTTGIHFRVATKNATANGVTDHVDGVSSIDAAPALSVSDVVYINIGNPIATLGNPMDGGVGECVLISGVISTDDRLRLEGYLAHKWGQTALLPAGHIYKTSPPYV